MLKDALREEHELELTTLTDEKVILGCTRVLGL